MGLVWQQLSFYYYWCHFIISGKSTDRLILTILWHILLCLQGKSVALDTKKSPLPFANVIGRLLGKHPLLEHVVERMDGTQLQSLLLMKHFSFAHTKTEKVTPQNTRVNVTGGNIRQCTSERCGS